MLNSMAVGVKLGIVLLTKLRLNSFTQFIVLAELLVAFYMTYP